MEMEEEMEEEGEGEGEGGGWLLGFGGVEDLLVGVAWDDLALDF